MNTHHFSKWIGTLGGLFISTYLYKNNSAKFEVLVRRIKKIDVIE